MRQPTDPDWVYGYDAWTEPLPEPALKFGGKADWETNPACSCVSAA